MRHDRNVKVVRMIPIPQLGANATVSAGTYGSGGHGTKGIVDTRGFNRALIEVRRGGGATKVKSVHIGFQSGATTLMASSTLLSGYTSGNWFTSSSTSQSVWLLDINLNSITNAKRYLNCKVVTSAASSIAKIDVTCRLTRGEQFPPSTTGYTSTTAVG